MLLVRGRTFRRGRLAARLRPWVYDNGAYSDFTAGKEFDWEAFWQDVARIRQLDAMDLPQWFVAPDIVGGGDQSLERSLSVVDSNPDLPWLLAVQDGMTPTRVAASLERDAIRGLFVGGSVEWKLRTGASSVAMAHGVGKICHIGRVGSYKRVSWAKWAGADSIDSCLPLWSKDKARVFFSALRQQGLFTDALVRD